MKLDWVKNGEMSGSNENIMDALLNYLPDDSVNSSNMKQFEVAHQYMSELWLRGISKDDFINYVKKGNL